MITTEVSPKELKLYAKKGKSKQDPEQVNAVRTSRLSDDMVSDNIQILEMCRQYYDSLSDFRDRRKRARKYHRGDQWHETIVNDSGETVTEENYILDRGKIPFKQNVIRQMIRSLLGQYRTNKSKTMVVARKMDDSQRSEMLTNALQTAQQVNATRELDARNLEELLMSGMVIGKTGYRHWKEYNREDVFTENVNPNTVFFNTDVRDPRLLDLRLIGELLDAPLEDVISEFATNEKEEEIIRGWYTGIDPRNVVLSKEGLTADRMDSMDFYIASDTNKARVIVVWELANEWRTYAHDYMDGSYQITKIPIKEIEAVNQQRLQVGAANGMPPESIPIIDARRKKEQFWTVKFLTPYGQCLYQSETVYAHESHPYNMVLFPLLDGEVWGLVEDVIDQQRSINRMISLIDFIMGSAAKGVLLVPEESIPDDMDISDFADEWTKYNGVIKLKTKNLKHLPEQISANVTNIGAQDMLAMQMKLMQDIAGVSSAIQGHEAKAGTPSSLYAQQALNSSVNTKDMFESFAWFRNQRDTKMLKVIQQFYDDNRYIAIAGNRYAEEAAHYDPDLVSETEFDLVVTEGVDSPVYRQILDDQLVKLLEMQIIDGKIFLENSSLPFADQILESINKRDQQMQKGGPGGAGLEIPPELQQQVEGAANPQAMELVNRLMAEGG